MSPLFIMYLKKRPWYFRDGDNIFKVNFTAEARDMVELGYQRVNADGTPYGVTAKKPVEKPEPAAKPIVQDKVDFSSFTRIELIKYCSDNNIQVKAGAPKADLVKACEESVNG